MMVEQVVCVGFDRFSVATEDVPGVARSGREKWMFRVNGTDVPGVEHAPRREKWNRRPPVVERVFRG
jgi:hypothetical protein